MQIVTASARAVRPFEAFHPGAEGQRRHGFGAFVAALVLAVACVAASAKKHSLATAALQQSRVQSSLAAANEKIQNDYLRLAFLNGWASDTQKTQKPALPAKVKSKKSIVSGKELFNDFSDRAETEVARSHLSTVQAPKCDEAWCDPGALAEPVSKAEVVSSRSHTPVVSAEEVVNAQPVSEAEPMVEATALASKAPVIKGFVSPSKIYEEGRKAERLARIASEGGSVHSSRPSASHATPLTASTADHSHVDPFLPHFKETKAQVLAQEHSAWAAAAASQGVAEARLKERKKKLSWPGMQERETRLKVAEWKRNMDEKEAEEAREARMLREEKARVKEEEHEKILAWKKEMDHEMRIDEARAERRGEAVEKEKEKLKAERASRKFKWPKQRQRQEEFEKAREREQKQRERKARLQKEQADRKKAARREEERREVDMTFLKEAQHHLAPSLSFPAREVQLTDAWTPKASQARLHRLENERQKEVQAAAISILQQEHAHAEQPDKKGIVMQARVPSEVLAGHVFHVMVPGGAMLVRVPPGSHPGDTVRFAVPAQLATRRWPVAHPVSEQTKKRQDALAKLKELKNLLNKSEARERALEMRSLAKSPPTLATPEEKKLARSIADERAEEAKEERIVAGHGQEQQLMGENLKKNIDDYLANRHPHQIEKPAPSAPPAAFATPHEGARQIEKEREMRVLRDIAAAQPRKAPVPAREAGIAAEAVVAAADPSPALLHALQQKSMQVVREGASAFVPAAKPVTTINKFQALQAPAPNEPAATAEPMTSGETGLPVAVAVPVAATRDMSWPPSSQESPATLPTGHEDMTWPESQEVAPPSYNKQEVKWHAAPKSAVEAAKQESAARKAEAAQAPAVEAAVPQEAEPAQGGADAAGGDDIAATTYAWPAPGLEAPIVAAVPAPASDVEWPGGGGGAFKTTDTKRKTPAGPALPSDTQQPDWFHSFVSSPASSVSPLSEAEQASDKAASEVESEVESIIPALFSASPTPPALDGQRDSAPVTKIDPTVAEKGNMEDDIPWARAVTSTPPKARAIAPLDFESSNDMTWPGGNTVVGQVERVERPSYDVHNNPEGLPDSRPLESDTDIGKQVSSVKMTILCVALSAFVCLLCVPSHTVMTLLSMLGVGGGVGATPEPSYGDGGDYFDKEEADGRYPDDTEDSMTANDAHTVNGGRPVEGPAQSQNKEQSHRHSYV